MVLRPEHRSQHNEIDLDQLIGPTTSVRKLQTAWSKNIFEDNEYIMEIKILIEIQVFIYQTAMKSVVKLQK